jgi:hypothetical protein
LFVHGHSIPDLEFPNGHRPDDDRTFNQTRANLVTSISKMSATAVIVAGGTLVGVIAGWDLAPMTLELGATQLATTCAVIGALFTLTGCCYASECAEARSENQRQLARLTRLNFLVAKEIRKDRSLRNEQATSGS